MTELNQQASLIMERARQQTDAWVEYVEALATLESPSRNPRSQGPVMDLLTASLEEMGFRVRRYAGRTSGGMLLARPVSGPPRGTSAARCHQLLLGHTDTVWAEGTLGTMPVERNGQILRGPGVFDMKAGLTQIIFALRVLRELDLTPEVDPLILINSDEEVGSDDSTPAIRRLARISDRVFVLEPGLHPDGKIKTGRKGTGTFHVRVSGKGAHAGLAPEEGASAIQELALVIQSLHALTDLDAGVTVNVGEIRGGVRPNVVAPEAEAFVDVRVVSMDQARWIEEQIRSIRARTPGTRVEIRGEVDRPPLEPTPRNRLLWDAARRVGSRMGLALEEGTAGGASDGNTSSIYAPTLDGVGAVGDGAHALHEHVHIERSLERCALLAGLLLLPPLARV